MNLKTDRLINSNLVSDINVFFGEDGNPLLAPRGVQIVNNKTVVSDTGQNRVFIWEDIFEKAYATPTVTLGQELSSSTGRNAGGACNASTLFYPSGLWTDGDKLIVADAWNHRVLIWHTFPTISGQPADVVIGQPDFFSNQPNVNGIGASPDANKLYWPYGVYSDGISLWIADTGNRRVLYFETLPTSSFASANAVIGKSDFTERDYNNEDAIWPYSVKISANGSMAITDTQYYRVLFWHDWKSALTNKADIIFGQASLHDNGQNQFGWFPDAHTLNWCYDSCFYKKGLWIADTGNSRILWHESIPPQNNAKAIDLLGQANFNTGSENQNSIRSTESSYYWPFSLSMSDGIMAAADTGNHRVVFNRLCF